MGHSPINPDIVQSPNRLSGVIRQSPNRVVAGIETAPGATPNDIDQPPNNVGSGSIQQNPNRVNAEITLAKDAYQLAKEIDPSIGTREEWLASLNPVDWPRLVDSWTEEPAFNATIPGGDVYTYVYGLTTLFRFIPDPYDSSEDAFYSAFTSGVLSGKLATRAQPI